MDRNTEEKAIIEIIDINVIIFKILYIIIKLDWEIAQNMTIG